MGGMCDLNPASVLEWNGRPRRATKEPLRYWTEYVETDKWYIDELLRDVPESERKAACEDEDFSDGSDDDASDVSEDAEYMAATEEEASSEEESEEEDESEDSGEEDGDDA